MAAIQLMRLLSSPGLTGGSSNRPGRCLWQGETFHRSQEVTGSPIKPGMTIEGGVEDFQRPRTAYCVCQNPGQNLGAMQ